VVTSLRPYTNKELDSLPEEVGINWNIERPIEKDYKSWNEYWIEFCSYIIEKYKHTNCRKK
jgi:hypothetical protein